MTFRDAFPILYTDDVERLARFYVEAFGFEQSFRWPVEGGAAEYLYLSLEPLGIGIGKPPGENDAWSRPTQPAGPGGVELCLYTDDVDRAAERLRALGARELAAPEDQPWGERMAYFLDPDGRPLHLAQPLTST
jgi:lactoylglutathione lyase